MKQDKGDYTGLGELVDGKGNKIDLSDFAKRSPIVNQSTDELKDQKHFLPVDYQGKNWDQLYQADQLEAIRTKYPDHYERLRKEKFKN
jgi:hypothetical protein